MLLEHFFKYYADDVNILPPISFEKFSVNRGANVVLREPLFDLMFSLRKIDLNVALKDSPEIDKLANVLESLCKRMSETDLEHMGLVCFIFSNLIY